MRIKERCEKAMRLLRVSDGGVAVGWVRGACAAGRSARRSVHLNDHCLMRFAVANPLSLAL